MESHLKTGGEILEYKNKATNAAFAELTEDCKKVFQEIKIRRKHRYVIFVMASNAFEVELIGDRVKDFEDFKKNLPFSECRFCIYDQEYMMHDGRMTSKLWFISWFPKNSTPYQKMSYTTSKTNFRETLTGVYDAQASCLEDIDELFGKKVQSDSDQSDDDDDD